MQRRAAATYAALFLVIAAGAYAVIGVAERPTVTVEDPAHSLSAGDTLPAGDRTYTVSSISAATNVGRDLRSADLTWVNETARYAATWENDSTVPPRAVEWAGQANRHTASLFVGSTVTLGGTDYALVVSGESASEATLVGPSENRTLAVGDTVRYEGHSATVLEVTAELVTLVWGDPYRVIANPAADPPSVTLVQDLNVSARLADDPAVENETVTRADGRRYVVYVANGSTRPLDAYLPAAETHTVAEGETIEYRGNTTTVTAVTNESVELSWTASRTNTLSLAEGDTTTLGGTEYVAHFPDNRTLELSTDVGAYREEVEAVDTYHERVNGLWGVSIISGLASLLLLGSAYLPSRY